MISLNFSSVINSLVDLFQGFSTALSQTTNFRLEKFAVDNFKFVENGTKFTKPVEKNAEGKGKIACYDQFLLVLLTHKNQGLLEKGIRRGVSNMPVKIKRDKGKI